MPDLQVSILRTPNTPNTPRSAFPHLATHRKSGPRTPQIHVHCVRPLSLTVPEYKRTVQWTWKAVPESGDGLYFCIELSWLKQAASHAVPGKARDQQDRRVCSGWSFSVLWGLRCELCSRKGLPVFTCMHVSRIRVFSCERVWFKARRRRLSAAGKLCGLDLPARMEG